MFIYKITNKVNGKVYVGQTIRFNKRVSHHKVLLRQGCHKNKALQSDFNNFGIDSFAFEIIEKVESSLNFDADQLERFWIKFYNSMNPEKGYNMQSGGISGFKQTEESKINKSNKMAGCQNPNFGKRGNLSPLFGRKHNENTKQLIGDTKKKRVVDLLTGFIWDSITDASIAYGVSISYVSMIIKGKRVSESLKLILLKDV